MTDHSRLGVWPHEVWGRFEQISKYWVGHSVTDHSWLGVWLHDVWGRFGRISKYQYIGDNGSQVFAVERGCMGSREVGIRPVLLGWN